MSAWCWGVQETERGAFLLSSMARLAGQWQMALPASLPAARAAAASFLAFAALPAATDDSAEVHCPPVSPGEKVPRPVTDLSLPVSDEWPLRGLSSRERLRVV